MPLPGLALRAGVVESELVRKLVSQEATLLEGLVQSKIEPIGSKVVQFESDAERMKRAKLARLPTVIQTVREQAAQMLQSQLKSYFERADDSLFDLADKSGSNEEQNIYFDSMREVRVRRHGIETNFANAIDQAFAAIAVIGGATAEEDVYDTLKADALSLVHDDDLEALVAVDSSVARANSEYGEAIQFISLRFDSLVPVKVYQKNNPLGPDVVCAAFMAEIKKLDISTKAKLLLFRLFDTSVIANLGKLYQRINEVLIENNVMPSLPGRGARQMRRDESARAGYTSSSTNVSTSSPYMADSSGNTAQVTPDVAEALTKLFGEQILAENTVRVSSEQLAANHLVQLLNAAQKMPIQPGVIVKGDDIRGMVGSASANTGGAAIGRVEDQVMNLVNMLFDFILEDRNVPDVMKTLISRMQIPIIKVALADKTFFAKKGNVARKLLNEMSTAAIGWQGDPETMDRDPLYRKIDEIVRTLLNDFSTDIAIFNDLLADFTAFLEKERKRIAVLERRTVDAEDGKAKAEVARARVAQELEVRTQDLILPEAVSKLLNEAWSNALFVCALKHGYESDEWVSMLSTADELLWSVQAPSDPAERQRLIKMVPTLLKKLRSGLETISYNPFEMSTLFKALETVHLGCIRGVSPVSRRSEQKDATSPDAPMSSELRSSELKAEQSTNDDSRIDSDRVSPEAEPEREDEGTSVEEITLEGLPRFSPAHEAPPSQAAPQEEAKQVLADEPEPLHYQQVENFVRGAWFEMHANEGPVRCRFAAFIKPTGKYIFVNRNGMKVAEKTKRELALLLKHNELRALDNSMLFDRALETIVSSMRKPR